MLVGISVECTVCHRTKKPHGRSAPLGMRYCDEDCYGYTMDPLPGCLWPGESAEDFGFRICSNATKDVPVCDCGHLHSQPRTAWAAGLECFACSECDCAEFSEKGGK